MLGGAPFEKSKKEWGPTEQGIMTQNNSLRTATIGATITETLVTPDDPGGPNAACGSATVLLRAAPSEGGSRDLCGSKRKRQIRPLPWRWSSRGLPASGVTHGAGIFSRLHGFEAPPYDRLVEKPGIRMNKLESVSLASQVSSDLPKRQEGKGEATGEKARNTTTAAKCLTGKMTSRPTLLAKDTVLSDADKIVDVLPPRFPPSAAGMTNVGSGERRRSLCKSAGRLPQCLIGISQSRHAHFITAPTRCARRNAHITTHAPTASPTDPYVRSLRRDGIATGASSPGDCIATNSSRNR